MLDSMAVELGSTRIQPRPQRVTRLPVLRLVLLMLLLPGSPRPAAAAAAAAAEGEPVLAAPVSLTPVPGFCTSSFCSIALLHGSEAVGSCHCHCY